MRTSLFRSGLGCCQTHRFRTWLSALMFIGAVLLASTTAHAQYFGKTGDQYPARDLDLSARTRVLIYNNENQPLDAFAYKGHDFKIVFVCTRGTSPEYRLTDHYQAQVWPRTDGSTAMAFAPNVSPFSGSYPNGTDAAKKYADSTTGLIDVLKIPLPPELGPVIAVIIDTATPVAWKIDKVVADGRTFDFRNTDGLMLKRVSNHFTTGGANYNLNNGPLTQGAALNLVARSHAAFGSVKLPLESFADAALRSRYSATESYLEPYKPTQPKTLTVRVEFANRWGRNTLVKAPTVFVILYGESAGGEWSEVKLLDTPLVVNSKFASFDVAGDFRVKAVDVSLAPGTDRADIVGIGLVVEQGLGPETPFSDWLSLTRGGIERGQMRRDGAGDAPLSVVNPDLDQRIRALSATANDKSLDTSDAAVSGAADAVFKGLTTDAAAQAAIARFRKSTQVAGVAFDTWFLRRVATPADTTALLGSADSVFQSTQVSAVEQQGWSAARKLLAKTLDDRAAALRWVDTLKAMADESAAARRSELDAAQTFLMLDGGILTTEAPKPPPSPVALRKDVRTVFGKVAPTVSLYGNNFAIVKEFAGRFGSFAIVFNLTLDLVDVLANGSEPSSPGTGQNTTSAGQDNGFRIASGNLILAYAQAATETKNSLEALRRLCVFDRAMVSDMASLAAAYEVARPTEAMTDFNAANVRAVRRQVLRHLLPHRGVLYGEPVVMAKDNIYFPAGQPAYAADPAAGIPMVWPPVRPATEMECRFYRADCDGVLAFSAYLAFAYAPLPGGAKEEDLQQRAYFHRWRLAFGSDATQTPVLATTGYPLQMTGADRTPERFNSTWAYIRSALSSEEVLELVRGAPLRIQQDPQIRCDAVKYATSGWLAASGQADSVTRCKTLVKAGSTGPIFAFPAYARSLAGGKLTALHQTTSHLPDAFWTDGKRPLEDQTWWTPEQKTSGKIDQVIFLYGTEKDVNQIVLPTHWVELR